MHPQKLWKTLLTDPYRNATASCPFGALQRFAPPRGTSLARRSGLRNRERDGGGQLQFPSAPRDVWFDSELPRMSTSRERMDDNKIDEAVLALLYLGVFERHPMMGARAWKSFDWEAMNRLHRKGLISDPVSKAKSVMLTETGLRRAEAAFRRLFEADD